LLPLMGETEWECRMTALVLGWIGLSAVIGVAWIATELKTEPRAGLLANFVLAAMVWPLVLVTILILMLVTESRAHDAAALKEERDRALLAG
jgi:hypothetical protein